MPARRGEQPLGLGLLGYEDGTWMLTTFGVAKVEPPHTFPEMLALANKLLPERTRRRAASGPNPSARWLSTATPPAGGAATTSWTGFRPGFCRSGDAVASFDPTYGQGMTMTVAAGRSSAPSAGQRRGRGPGARSEPRHRQDHLPGVDDDRDRRPHLPPRDRGRRRGGTRPVGSLFDQFLGAAETDPVLAEWFLRRFSLLDSLYMVPSPRLVGRTIRHNMRLWLAERRQARRERRGALAPRLITDPRWPGRSSSARARPAGWDRRRRPPRRQRPGRASAPRTCRAPPSNPRCTAGSADRRGATARRPRGRVGRHANVSIDAANSSVGVS